MAPLKLVSGHGYAAPQGPDDLASQLHSDRQPADNAAMTTHVTHVELDAKLEAIEARADARMSRFEERMDAAIGEMRRTSDRFEERMWKMESSLESSISSLKTTVIVTAVSSVLAIVLGVAAFNATVLSNMVASFESGKGTATAIQQAAEQLKETQQQLNEIRAAQQKTPAK